MVLCSPDLSYVVMCCDVRDSDVMCYESDLMCSDLMVFCSPDLSYVVMCYDVM